MENEKNKGFLKGLLNKIDQTFTVERPESIELDDYTGFEDLYKKFADPSNRGVGFRKTVEQKVDDYDGRPGTIKISHKDKNDYSIKFWPDMGQEWVDEQNLKIDRAGTLVNAPVILSPAVQANKALRGKYFYMPPKTKQPPIKNVTPNQNDITVLTDLKSKITAPYKPWQTQAVPFGQTSPNITSEVYDAALSTGATARLRRRPGESDANFSIRLGAQLFDEINLTYDAELDVYNMLDRGGLSEKKRRIAKMLISNPDYSPKSFEDTRTLLVAEFLDGLEFLGLADRTIEAHHIASLRQVTSLFIGLPRSKFREMLKLVYAEDIPTGNDPRNLMAIQKKAHVNKKDNPNVYAVHTYLNEQLGIYGEKLVGDYGAKIKDLSVEERIPYIKTFAKVVKNSVPIAEQAIRDVLDLDIQEKDPGAFASAALDIEQYDISVSQMKQIKAKIKNKLELQFNNPGEEALLDAIRGENTPGEALRRRDAFSSQTRFDTSKKAPKKTKSKKISKNQQKYFDDPDVTKPTQ